METAGQNSKILISNILKCANEANYNSMISFISTPQGFADFSASIRSNHTLSLIFLKNYIQKWIDSRTLEFLYDSNFIHFIIQSCVNNDIKQGNLVHVADYFEILSSNYLIPIDTLSTLINLKMFILVDAIFKKYVTHPRSNKLFTEINTTIPIFFPVFIEIFFNPSILNEINSEYQKVLDCAQKMVSSTEFELIQPRNISNLNVNQNYILNIFYSLTFQDIHPLFEDNIDHFFKVFFILFDQNQLIINQIFELFITKYPEIANFQLTILTLSRFNSLDGLIVNTLTKAYSSSKTFPMVVLNYLQRNLNIKMSDDWLSNTQNFIKGNDIQRGFTHKLIRLLNCSPYSFKGESMFFVATILKFKDPELVNKALSSVNSEISDFDLVFSAFAYLITIHEFGPCSVSYLDTDLKFICMKFLSNFIKSKEFYHKSKILKSFNNEFIAHSESLESVYSMCPLYFVDVKKLFEKVLSILQINHDEFSSNLLFRLVENDKSFLTSQLYDFLSRIFANIHMISVLSLNYLFEIYISLSISLKKYNFELVETILNKEIIDAYNLCFYYISVLIQETDMKESFIIYILSQNALWNTKELRSGLCCILISAYRKRMIKKEQIENIVQLLDGFDRIFVLYRSGLTNTNDFSCEENFLVNGQFDSNWFIENYLNKKYTRMVIKKMISDKMPLTLIKQIFDKNIANIEFETYPHSITIFFDI